MSGSAEAPHLGQCRRSCLVMVLVSLVCAPISWVDDGVTPSWVVYPVVLLVAARRLLRGRGALFLGAAAVVFLTVHLPFAWAGITSAEHSPTNSALPASPIQWLVTLFAVPLVTSAVGWTTWSKERSRSVTSP